MVNRFVLLSYTGVNPAGNPPATILIKLALEVDSYTIGVISVSIHTVVVADPLIKLIVASGLIVIVPLVVAVTQIPPVAMVYVKIPDSVAVPLIVKVLFTSS